MRGVQSAAAPTPAAEVEAAFYPDARPDGGLLELNGNASPQPGDKRSVEGMPRNLKVLHVAETVRGGIATYLNEIHRLQTREFGRDNVSYIVPSHHRADLTEIPDEAVVTFSSRGRAVPSLLALAIAVLRQVAEQQPDIVHLHSTFAGAVLRPILGLMPRRPAIVYCPHGWAFSRQVSWPSRFATRLIERALCTLADQIVCISENEFAAARSVGIDDGRLALVPNGISTRRIARWKADKADRSDERLRVLFVGRFDRQKGYDFLIEAACALSEAITVRLVGAKVIGGDMVTDLPPNVAICGWMRRERIEDEYDWADVVVMPSRWEGFGLVGLEAMRAGRPIVAFRSGALEEIVVDGVTGILCASADAAGLIAGLRRAAALDLPGMGRCGSQRFRELFAVERTHDGLVKAYRTAVARERAKDPTLARVS